MQEISLDTADQAWQEAPGYAAGTLRRVLRANDDGNPLTMLLKLPAGFEMEGHSHTCLEQHYVLEGAYQAQGRTFGPGSYRLIPGHAGHGPFRSKAGAVVLVFWEG